MSAAAACSSPRQMQENTRPSPARSISPPSSPPRRHKHVSQDDSEDGYSSHPSIYSASPVESESGNEAPRDPTFDNLNSTKSVFALYSESQRRRSSTTRGNSHNAVDYHANDDANSDANRNRGGELQAAQAIHGGHGNPRDFPSLGFLDTITEQKSKTTLEIREDLDDLDNDQDNSYVTDESEYGDQMFYDYASPTQPLHPRISSLPNAPLHSHPSSPFSIDPTHAALQTFFSRSPGQLSTTLSTPHAQRPQAFRAPTSMNRSYGTLSSHPFHRAPVAEAGPVPNRMPTPDRLDSPLPRDSRGGGIFGKLWRVMGGVCCCLQPGDGSVSSSGGGSTRRGER
ncbi:hypothetical protein BZA77DRAFT_307027 [Pyronema omphalodes]|nr:hypothetical protein BZA77DRAFT_307027 [Pyronema omphalodes]